MSGENQGPDLYFAGGECLDRFGVLLRRTDLDLEEATRESDDRGTDANAVGRDGILRLWDTDRARVEYLNEVDLDATRNILDSTDILRDWQIVTPTVDLVSPGIWRIEDLDPLEADAVQLTDQFATATELTYSCYVRRLAGAPTCNLRLTAPTVFGVKLNPETGEFAVDTAGTAAVELVGNYWRISITITTTVGELMTAQFFPAWNFPGNLGGITDAALGANTVQRFQLEAGDTATAFQAIPRDFDRKFASLLLEASTTNNWTFSEELDNAVWILLRATVSSNTVTAPDGAATGDKLVEDATASATHQFSRATPTLVDDSENVVSFYARSQERRWLSIVTTPKDNSSASSFVDVSNGTLGTVSSEHSITIENLAASWFRVRLIWNAKTGATPPSVIIRLATDDGVDSYTGDGTSGLFIWGLQFETKEVPSSYVSTGGATATRLDDVFSAPYPTPPVAMTAYAKFIERGTILKGASLRLFAIGFGDNPQFYVTDSGSGNYTCTLIDADGVSRSAVAAATPALRDLVELRALIAPDGSVQIGQSINGASEEVTPPSSALALESEWNAPLIEINNVAGANLIGLTAFLALKINRGVRSLDFMRRL